MRLLHGLLKFGEMYELLAVLVTVGVVLIGLAVVFVIETVKWNIPSLRRRMIEDAKRRRQEEEQARRGKYGARQFRHK